MSTPYGASKDSRLCLIDRLMFAALCEPGMKEETLVEMFDQVWMASHLPSNFSEVPPRPTGYARAVSMSTYPLDWNDVRSPCA